MRLFFSVIACLFATVVSFGQGDSLNMPSATKADLLRQDAVRKMDSLSAPASALRDNVITDTLGHINNRLDSIRLSVDARVDSLTSSYTSVLTDIRKTAQGYQSKIDSLQSLKLPADKYKSKIDSLSQKLTNVQRDLADKVEGIRNRAMEKIKSIKYPPELEEKVTGLTSSVGKLGPQTIEAKLPPELNLDKLSALKGQLSLGGLEKVTNVDVPGIPQVNGLDKQPVIPGLTDKVPDIKGMDKVGDVSGQAQAVQGKIYQTAKELNPNSIDKLAESKAPQMKEVKVLQEQTTELPMNGAASEEEMKAKLKEEAQKVAVDHFAGKEQQLKAAMARISKYKAKYPSISSIADIAKRPPNPMRNKPFIERIVPGIGMQIRKKGVEVMVDFNPYVGYRFTGRITAGPGWNQRVAYNFDDYFFNPEARIFGPRIFGEFKLGKGFSPRAEVEVMNTKIPPSTITTAPDPQVRQWVWGAFAGIKKEYKFFRHVRGTASVMTRLFNPKHKSPYADVLNVRFGFEFPVRKNARPKLQ